MSRRPDSGRSNRDPSSQMGPPSQTPETSTLQARRTRDIPNRRGSAPHAATPSDRSKNGPQSLAPHSQGPSPATPNQPTTATGSTRIPNSFQQRQAEPAATANGASRAHPISGIGEAGHRPTPPNPSTSAHGPPGQFHRPSPAHPSPSTTQSQVDKVGSAPSAAHRRGNDRLPNLGPSYQPPISRPPSQRTRVMQPSGNSGNRSMQETLGRRTGEAPYDNMGPPPLPSSYTTQTGRPQQPPSGGGTSNIRDSQRSHPVGPTSSSAQSNPASQSRPPIGSTSSSTRSNHPSQPRHPVGSTPSSAQPNPPSQPQHPVSSTQSSTQPNPPIPNDSRHSGSAFRSAEDNVRLHTDPQLSRNSLD
jgi:hypothetical protein